VLQKMKEAAFRDAVLTKLPARFHRQPNLAGAYGVAGTPDTYLDGARDLWVEWKVVPGEDYYPRELKNKYLPTALQREWLDRRYRNGGNALCIVGFKLRGRAWGVVLETPKQWSHPVPRESYEPRLQRAGDLALYLEGRLT
jgi:hypothetical protein